MPKPQNMAAMTTAAPDPAARQRDREGADGRGRVEEPEHTGPAQLLRKGREERHRHPEEHRHHVDGVRPHELRPALRVAKALQDAADARRLRPRGRRDGAHERECDERDRERDEIDGVGDRKPEGSDEDPRGGRPRDHADVAAEGIEGARGRNLVPLDEPGDERVKRGSLDAVESGHRRGNHEQHRQLRLVEE
jgi:hypothetical protein